MSVYDAEYMSQSEAEAYALGKKNGYKVGYLRGKEDAASPWHRVEDELPEKEGDYLVWTMLYGGHAYTDYYTPKYGWDEYKVIAWMPLPEPPKEDA